ncbi:MAG: hypothetical protein ABH950_00465 [Candidatus Altiarchaeota archaeon]
MMVVDKEEDFLRDPVGFCKLHETKEIEMVEGKISKKAAEAVEFLGSVLRFDRTKIPLDDVQDASTPLKKEENDRMIVGEVTSTEPSKQRILLLVDLDRECIEKRKLFPEEKFKELVDEYQK